MESGFADVTYGGAVKRIVEAQKEVSLKVISREQAPGRLFALGLGVVPQSRLSSPNTKACL